MTVQKSRVALVRCDSYNREAVQTAVERGIDLLGGIEQCIRPDEKILLKPNLLVADPPERAVTCHPEVLRAVARAVQSISKNVGYGDSPGIGSPKSQSRKAGYADIAAELGLELADFSNGREIDFHDSPFTKKFTIANGVLAADALVTLPKLKTHGLTRFTGAVKNQLGCVPGFNKAEWHVKIPNGREFGKMLVALNLLLQPRLCIMDGIWAMQGNGPRGGSRKAMNVLLLSTDPVAIDATACRLIDLDPKFVPTMQPGQDWGLGVYERDSIEVVGESLSALIQQDFDVKREPVADVTYRDGARLIKNWVSPRPVIHDDKCVHCGICVNACPVSPKALDWEDDKTKPPVYNYRRCIRCFCCQEMCPEQAITVETPWFARTFLKR